MTSLTDRYVFTVLRQVPEPQRADLEKELRSSIADLADAHRESGASPADAEIQALQELGDPDKFAASVAGRRQYLIGPELYSTWLRLLRLLLSTVVPIAAVAHAVVLALTGSDVGDIIAGLISTAIEVALYTAASITIIFAILERTGTARTTGGAGAGTGIPSWRREWTPDQLPEYAKDRRTIGDFAFELVWLALVALFVIGQQFWSLSVIQGERVPVLSPAEWSFWWPYFLVVVVLEAVLAAWIWRGGGWTLRAAVVKIVLSLAAAIPLVWLASQQRIFNPEFFDKLGWTSPAVGSSDMFTVATIAFVVIAFATDVTQSIQKVRQANAGVPAQVPGTGIRV